MVFCSPQRYRRNRQTVPIKRKFCKVHAVAGNLYCGSSQLLNEMNWTVKENSNQNLNLNGKIIVHGEQLTFDVVFFEMIVI
jgi:hypothetical protein